MRAKSSTALIIVIIAVLAVSVVDTFHFQTGIGGLLLLLLIASAVMSVISGFPWGGQMRM